MILCSVELFDKGWWKSMTIYDKIKNDISQQPYYEDNFPNEGQRFIAWYLRNIHNLDIYQTKDCITDGSNDKQIDAVYVDDQNQTIYIIQGKFYSGDSVDAEPLREVLSSWLQIQDLKNLQESANEKLKSKILDIHDAIAENYDISFELITTSKLSKAASSDLDLFQKQISTNETLNANIVVIDETSLETRYNESLNKNRPYINHEFMLEDNKYLEMTLDGTKVVIAAISLKECIRIPGIKDGTLFRKNVRQSLGSNNKVNKGIAKTVRNNPSEFFFLHNGITAICSSMTLDSGLLSIKDLNVVNGCQSLSTLYSCSASAEEAKDAYIMFRFYEIDKAERADDISNSTNSQSAVKARDLRSNDKYVLAMKKDYEQKFPDGYLITKRGEKADSPKYNKEHIIDLTLLGKWLMAWHSQRPNMSYSENRVFDVYFNQLFHRNYSPDDIQALNEIYRALLPCWSESNPKGIDESLHAMRSYGIYHQMYAVSILFCELSNIQESVPKPSIALAKIKSNNCMDTIVNLSIQCLNIAFTTAYQEKTQNGKVFSAQNWSKSKESLKDIRGQIKQQIATLRILPNAQDLLNQLMKLRIPNENYEQRWSAD